MADDLLTLGPGNGGKEELLKLNSAQLRGTLAESLAQETDAFDEAGVTLLKFHGSYQQDNRDQRPERRAANLGKAYEFMVRSRIPGGVLTAKQYLVHDDLAQQYGSGSVRLTTRQGIQLHGVLKGDLRATIRSINESLLSTLAACGDVNRNVMACPAPIRSHAQAHVSEFAHRIAMHLAPRSRAYHEIWLDGEDVTPQQAGSENAPVQGDSTTEEPIYGKTYLPRKFKIGVAFSGDNCIDVYTQDIGFVAHVERDELLGFTVLVGGGMGSTHGKVETFPRLATPLCFARPDDVLEIAETIVTIQRDYGNRKNRKQARMKYLVEERGIAWFRQELEQRLGRVVDDPHPVIFADADDHLGWHEQADGTWFLGIWIENGRVVDSPSSCVRSALRRVLERFECGLRITGQQNLLLTDLPAHARPQVERILHEFGVEPDPRKLGIRRSAMACPALPTCGLAVAEAERVLPSLLEELEREVNALGLRGVPLSIRMTGCPNGCVRPRMGDIGIIGRSLDLYDIFLGGDLPNTRLNTIFAQGVKRTQIVAMLRPVLEAWKRAGTTESLGDFTDRIGHQRLRELTGAVQTA